MNFREISNMMFDILKRFSREKTSWQAIGEAKIALSGKLFSS